MDVLLTRREGACSQRVPVVLDAGHVHFQAVVCWVPRSLAASLHQGWSPESYAEILPECAVYHS